jgi:hypothetical protein
MESLLRDALVALRRLRRAPGFTLFAVVSLAVGIGVSTAVYSAARTLLFMPLGIADEQSLVVVTSHRVVRASALSWLDYQELRGQPTSAAMMGAAAGIRTALSTATLRNL